MNTGVYKSIINETAYDAVRRAKKRNKVKKLFYNNRNEEKWGDIYILKFCEENSDSGEGLFINQTEYEADPLKLRFGEIRILPTYINVYGYGLKNHTQKLKFRDKVSKRACQELMVSPVVNIGDLNFKSPYDIEIEDKHVVIYLTTNHPFIIAYLVIDNLDEFISVMNNK